MLTEGQTTKTASEQKTRSEEPLTAEADMQLSHLSLLCLGLLVNLHVFTSHPVPTGLGGNDVDLLKVSLQQVCHRVRILAVEFD